MPIEKKLLLILAVVALLGTVTNFVYFSPLLTLLLPLAIYVLNKEKLERPVAWLYGYLTIFLVSVAVYYPQSLVTFEFYRRDGNFLIAYAPLLILPLFSMKFDYYRMLRIFFVFATGLYALTFGWHLVQNYLVTGTGFTVFGGLFHAQNAVGGFLAILGALAFAYWWRYRTRNYFLLFLFVFVILFLTYSRGSILGLALGIAGWFLADRRMFKTLILLIVIPVILTAGSLFIGYPYYENRMAGGDMATIEMREDVETKNMNILLRVFYTFPRAWYSFQHSPVVGTGVGSFDDLPYRFEEVMPLVATNAQPQKLHTDNHAHHSYLHILAEQGIVGLIIFLIFWYKLFLYLLNLKHKPIIRNFLLIAFFTITFASFTEHRITTPSMMLPFTIPLGLLFAHVPATRRYRLEEVKTEP
jgi:O-antigen ligase